MGVLFCLRQDLIWRLSLESVSAGFDSIVQPVGWRFQWVGVAVILWFFDPSEPLSPGIAGWRRDGRTTGLLWQFQLVFAGVRVILWPTILLDDFQRGSDCSGVNYSVSR